MELTSDKGCVGGVEEGVGTLGMVIGRAPVVVLLNAQSPVRPISKSQ